MDASDRVVERVDLVKAGTRLAQGARPHRFVNSYGYDGGPSCVTDFSSATGGTTAWGVQPIAPLMSTSRKTAPHSVEMHQIVPGVREQTISDPHSGHLVTMSLLTIATSVWSMFRSVRVAFPILPRTKPIRRSVGHSPADRANSASRVRTGGIAFLPLRLRWPHAHDPLVAKARSHPIDSTSTEE